MAQTYRRERHCYEYRWVLHDWDSGKLLGDGAGVAVSQFTHESVSLSVHPPMSQ